VANRNNHYEAAFEAFLAGRRIPYVAVDETRRAKWGDGSLKSLDFIVSVGPSNGGTGSGGPGSGGSWLVDVKGRRFPSGQQKQYWKNWSTRDDLQSLAEWQRLFGGTFAGLFVFAYVIVGQRAPLAEDQIFDYKGRGYGFVGIRRDEYARHAHPISARWDTVAMPTGLFRQLARPIDAFLTPPPIERRDLDAA
jgi:hypothetical protein